MLKLKSKSNINIHVKSTFYMNSLLNNEIHHRNKKQSLFFIYEFHTEAQMFKMDFALSCNLVF